jgi:molecular chaperone HscB
VGIAAPFCPTCKAVQPPAALDAFTRLGVAPAYWVDLSALDPAYFALQRQLHPDRFATQGGKARAYSQQQAAALNDAYEALKQPVARGAALLRVHGRKADFDGQGTVDDPGLLMEAMEMREALMEAEDGATVATLVAKADADAKALQGDIAAAFEKKDFDGAEQGLLRLRYLERFAVEARARRQKLAAA